VDKIFCQFNLSNEFCKEFGNDDEALSGFNKFCKKLSATLPPDNERKQKDEQLIKVRTIRDESGYEKNVWGCDPQVYHFFEHLNLSSPAFNKMVKLELLPKNVRYAMSQHEEISMDKEKMNQSIIHRVTEPIWNSLKLFQQECVRYCLSRQGRALIADDMGLGKTREVLAVLNYYKAWPALIVCPSLCKSSWEKEIIQFLKIEDPSFNIEIISEGGDLTAPFNPPEARKEKKGRGKEEGKEEGKKKDSDDNGKRKIETDSYTTSSSIVSASTSSSLSSTSHPCLSGGKGARETGQRPMFTVVSYTLLTMKREIFEARGYKTIVVDESQKTKNYETKCSQAVVKIAQGIQYAFFLSGTPLVKPKEIFPTMNALYPKIFPDFYSFANRYCDPQKVNIRIAGKNGSKGGNREICKYDGRENSNELHIVLTTLMMIRRKEGSKGVDLKLPRKYRTFFVLNPDKKQINLVSKHMAKIDTSTLVGKIAEIKEAKVNDDGSVKEGEGTVGEEKIEQEFGKDNAFMSAYRKIAKIKLALVQNYIRGACFAPLTPEDGHQNNYDERKVEKKITKNKKKNNKKQESSSDEESDDDDDEEEEVSENKSEEKIEQSSLPHFCIRAPSSSALANTTSSSSSSTTTLSLGGPRGASASLDRPHHKVIIFAHHQIMLDGIEDVLQEQGIGFVRMDGKTNKKLTKGIVETFQTNPNCRVALLSITAAGAGLTLTAATKEIFAEMHPSADTVIQAECRAHRIGQTEEVECIYLAFPNSIEEILWQLINKKYKSLTCIVDGGLKKFSAKRVTEV
jgi:SNF2 family DNA or RNA helicase